MERGLGYIPSPPDARDHKLVGIEDTALFGLDLDSAPTEHFDLLPFISTVLNQLNTNSCVWNAIRQQHYIVQGVMGVKERTPLSVLFGYHHTRKLSGTQDADLGCIPRFAWKAAKNMGFCPDKLWPFNPAEVNRPPSFDATAGAIDQKWVDGYYNIWGLTGRDNEVRQAISHGHPVVFGTKIDADFQHYRDASRTPQPLKPPSGPIKGGHMMCAVAYDTDGLWVVNSWGLDWGTADPSAYFSGGFFRMSWDWVNWPLATDWWAVKYAPTFLSK